MINYKYFGNKILNFDTKDVTDEDGKTQKDSSTKSFKVYDFNSLNIRKIRALMSVIPDSWIGYTKIQNNTNVEKLANDIYGNPDFWDILVILNNRNPLFEWPYDFDVIEHMTDSMITKYEKYVYKKKMSDSSKEKLRKQLYDKISEQNEQFRYIRYIFPENIYEFISLGKKYGVF